MNDTRTYGHKPFSVDTYNRTDKQGKETAALFLESKGFTISELQLEKNKSERFKVCDFEVTNNDKVYLIEVEVRERWKDSGQWMKFNTVHVPYRKKNTKSNFYVVINASHDTLAICKTKDILNSTTVNIDTRSTIAEDFFDVSLDKFKFYNKINDKWIYIKDPSYKK
jgi:Holliday junction resolvase-like predicted endonuclease